MKKSPPRGQSGRNDMNNEEMKCYGPSSY